MALCHCPVTRAALADAARQAGVEDRLLIPADGETLSLNHPAPIDAARLGAGQESSRNDRRL